MVKKLAIFSLAVAAALSCGQRQVGGFHPRPFPQASVPAMVTDRAEAASFFAEHFWDEFTDTTQLYFCDSSTVNGVKLTDVEQAFANYLAFLGMVDIGEASSSMARLFSQVSAMEAKDTASNVFETISRLARFYLYDPNSPYRDEDIYYPFVDGLASSVFVPDAERTAYGYDARMCSLNRKGTRAADFAFCDKDVFAALRGRAHSRQERSGKPAAGGVVLHKAQRRPGFSRGGVGVSRPASWDPQR